MFYVLLIIALMSPMNFALAQTPTNPYDSPEYYFNSDTQIGVEVFFEEGASPYVGYLQTTHPTPLWQFLENNLKELFAGRLIQPQFIIPKDITEMKQFESQKKTDWTDEDLYSLAKKLRTNQSSEKEAWFTVLYLNGYYNSNGKTQPKILSVSIGGTAVIALFKPVIESTNPSTTASSTEKFIEQSTLVHSMGNALGLVNNGLSIASNEHEDPMHPTQCNNSKCVMFWEVSSDSLVRFLDQYQKTGSMVIFGDECLKDAQLYSKEP